MFITYNDLDDMRDARKRSQINAFVNRGRKANKIKFAQNQARSVQWQQSRQTIRTSTPIKVESGKSISLQDVVDIQDPRRSEEILYALLKRRRLPKAALQYGLGGLRRDPFTSFPILQSGQVEWAADFCKSWCAKESTNASDAPFFFLKQGIGC